MSNSDGHPDIRHAKAWLTEISRELKLMSPYAADGRYVSKDLIRLVGPDSHQSLSDMAATIDYIVERAHIGLTDDICDDVCGECGNELGEDTGPGQHHSKHCSLWTIQPTGAEPYNRKAT